ncbi:hypothetical protein [Moraxella nonliquefaciens]|nr:hypothetical protein [Moraxella nonliquefaciens]MCG7412035.1 hypothetical protein [Moraxella nonliquefaciens]
MGLYFAKNGGLAVGVDNPKRQARSTSDFKGVFGVAKLTWCDGCKILF